MSILSDFEDSLARGVEGMFAGAFRSPVQPAEVAKALAKTMDSSRLASLGWKPGFDPVDGVAATAEWYRRNDWWWRWKL